MKKSKLCKAIAMAVALGGLGVGLYAQTASAVNLSPTKLGDVLIFPYYTVRDGFQTTLTFINTSNEFLAVKFRFMEGYNSRDVLDFNVLMSPFDVYTGVVEAGNGAIGDTTSGVRFRIPASETTCTAPYLAPDSSFGLSSVAYTTVPGNPAAVNADGGPTGNERLAEGYVLAMVMGHANRADLTALATENPPVAPNTLALKAAAAAVLGAEHPNTATECTAVVNLFDTPNFLTTARLFGEPLNVLKGNYSLLNVPRGTAAGGNATTLSNFFNIAAATDFVRPAVAAGNGQANILCDVPYAAQFNYAAFPNIPVPALGPAGTVAAPPWFAPVVGNGIGGGASAPGGCPNLLTPQVFPYFLEPSLNNAYAPATNTGAATQLSNLTGGLGAAYVSYANSGFQAVSEVLRASTLSNEWSVNPNLGVSTNWVVTHPTKAFFVDDPLRSSSTAVALPGIGSTARADTVQAAINAARFAGVVGPAGALPIRPMTAVAAPGGLNPFPSTFSASTATGVAGTSCVTVGVNIWDRDELTASAGGVTPSPIVPSANRQLCHEVNVIEFNPNNQQVFNSALAVDMSGDVSALWAQATAARPAQPFGWLRLNLGVDPAAVGGVGVGTAVNPVAGGTTLLGPGLPTIGFMMRERVIDTANVQGNYGDSAEHSYTK